MFWGYVCIKGVAHILSCVWNSHNIVGGWLISDRFNAKSVPLEDPASENFSDNKLNKFREVRDLIKYKLKELKTNFGD